MRTETNKFMRNNDGSIFLAIIVMFMLAPYIVYSRNLPVNDSVMLRIKLGEGADVNEQDENGNTALHDACMGYRLSREPNQTEYYKSAKILISNNSNVNATNKYGSTPIENLVGGNNPARMAELLINHGAKYTIINKAGMPLLWSFMALGDCDSDIVKLILSKYGNVNLPLDAKRSAALHYAAGLGCYEIAQYLLANGANPNANDINRDTPLHFAAGYGHYDVVKYLIANGANPNIKNSNSDTPLQCVIKTIKDEEKYRQENPLNGLSNNDIDRTYREKELNRRAERDLSLRRTYELLREYSNL